MRIGEMARLVGVSERTLRYYEELGLVMATRQNPRGSRHYDEVQVARVLRIKELQGLLGFNLLEISTILQAQDRIDELRGELAEHDDAPSRRQILQEGLRVSRRLHADVAGKLAHVAEFLGQVDEQMAGTSALLSGLDATEAAASPRIAAASVGPSSPL